MKAHTLQLTNFNDIENIRKKATQVLNTFVKNKKQKIEVTFANAKSQRSLKQNSLIHGLFNQISVNSTHVGNGEYYSPKIWKEYLKDQYLPKNKTIVLGSEVVEMKSTAKLNRKECAEFTNHILRFCAENEIEIMITTDDYDFLTRI